MANAFGIKGASFGKGDVVDFKRIDKVKVLSHLWVYARRHMLRICLILFFVVISNILALLSPVVTGKAIAAMEGGPGKVDFSLLAVNAGLLGVLYLSSALFTWLQNIFMIRMTQQVIYDIRVDVFSHIESLPMSFFDGVYKGDIISRISYDIDNISSCFSTDLVHLLTGVITVTGSLLMMIMINPTLTLVFCIIVPVSFLFARKITKYTRKLFRLQQYKYGELNAYVEEALTGQKTLKAYCHEQASVEGFHKVNGELNDSGYKAQFFSSIVMPVMNFLSNLGFLLVSSFGAFLMLRGRLDISNLSSFILYSKKFSGPINETANIINVIQSAFSASERVFSILEVTPEAREEETRHLEEAKGEVDIHDIFFSYLPDKELITHFSLKAPKGSHIAIVGHTGAGKTTIANLLMKFYNYQKGEIRIDRKDIQNIERQDVRSQYGMVLQDTWLFQGTVMENLRYGRFEATDEEVIAAAKAADAHDFIMKLPQGYDTVISEDVTSMSQGQKQLLTIARALIADPPMLILDEATSSVDTITENKIQKAMDLLMEGRTSFVIAHRLSTIRNADIIIVMEEGKIVEQGRHEELLEKKGAYYTLYNSQFADV
ncbi:MAG: ABC transporter ATP-binding protein [Oscillospiraceae bacterium]|jgi:ATP-binding cassette subfamily B protein|nr:ABC transporter ATP-binding protein [Oscillospiraceae bacterium]